MIAFTSQLPHVLACSYISDPLALSHKGFSAGSFLDVTRVAFINDVMWSELFIDNADHLCDEIDELIKNLSAFKTAIKNEDKQSLSRMMIKSRELKEKT
ncbi:MAG: prephenate dehydrogenase/arogenate dehydrogenase family protein [Clostridia bacterium]|nr:prephenate dehydrogenase/arogenate dehydrogenase family protein [Clostridia bacterium]